MAEARGESSTGSRLGSRFHQSPQVNLLPIQRKDAMARDRCRRRFTKLRIAAEPFVHETACPANVCNFAFS